MVVGLSDGITKSNEFYRISLQHLDKVTTLTAIPTKIQSSNSAVCVLNNNVYISVACGDRLVEAYTWNVMSGWIRCADMLTGRRHHCAAVVNTTLYVLGGRKGSSDTTVSSVEGYNTLTNKWSSAGHLVHGVYCTACVTYKNSIYVFGGRDKENKAVSHVQVYNPAQESCTLMDQPMPSAHSHMRAVLWETSVILLGIYTCYIYNFETQTWQEREQFKTGVDYFASALDNSTVYIGGGGTYKTDKDNRQIWTRTDEMKSVSVLDIIEDKPAVWKHHATLPKPALLHSYGNMALPLLSST